MPTLDFTIDKKGLRNFGLILAGMFPLWFGLLLPVIFRHGWPVWPWIVGIILAIWSLALPATLKPIYIVWTCLGHVLGWINTRVILLLIFILLFAPIGLLFRLIGKDPMRRKLDPGEESYRVPSTHQPKEHMERPY